MSDEACKRLWWHHQSNFRPGLRPDVDEPAENNGKQCQRLSSWVTGAFFLLHLRSLDLSFLSLVDSSQLSAQGFHESTALGELEKRSGRTSPATRTCTQQLHKTFQSLNFGACSWLCWVLCRNALEPDLGFNPKFSLSYLLHNSKPLWASHNSSEKVGHNHSYLAG